MISDSGTKSDDPETKYQFMPESVLRAYFDRPEILNRVWEAIYGSETLLNTLAAYDKIMVDQNFQRSRPD